MVALAPVLLITMAAHTLSEIKAEPWRSLFPLSHTYPQELHPFRFDPCQRSGDMPNWIRSILGPTQQHPSLLDLERRLSSEYIDHPDLQLRLQARYTAKRMTIKMIHLSWLN